MSTITVVIPCFNEEDVLPGLFERLTRAAGAWGVDWEVLLVDDGSRDRTWEMLSAQSRKDPRFQAIRFSRNFGHQPAVSAGLDCARGDAVAVMDADLEDPPEVLKEFIAKWREGYQVVYAIRTKRKEGFFKRTAYWAFYRIMSRLVDFKLPLDTGDFCLMDRAVVGVIRNMPEKGRYIRGLRAWAGFKQIGVSYERAARAAGDPKYNFRRLMRLATDGIFSFSTVPLRVVSTLGFWISAIAFLGFVFTFLQRIFKSQFALLGLAPVPGYATIVMSVLFMGGVQLICLGIIGEYLGRVYDEVKRRPAWIVSQRTEGIAAPPPQDTARSGAWECDDKNKIHGHSHDASA
jgi:dolichol-phosphate mannosyltransferase